MQTIQVWGCGNGKKLQISKKYIQNRKACSEIWCYYYYLLLLFEGRRVGTGHDCEKNVEHGSSASGWTLSGAHTDRQIYFLKQKVSPPSETGWASEYSPGRGLLSSESSRGQDHH